MGARFVQAKRSYSTSFPLSQTPLSEAGNWIQQNIYYTKAISAAGYCYGNQPNPANPGIFEDAYAYLGGYWPRNQYAAGRLKKGTIGGDMEAELLLCWSDTPDATNGLECGIHMGGNYWFVNKPGGYPLSSAATQSYYTEIRPGSSGGFTPPSDGDFFEAQIVGNTVSIWVAGNLLGNVDVSGYSFPNGAPGLGFFTGSNGGETANTNVGFYSYTARAL